MGRRSKYGTYVQPYLEDITKWIQHGEYEKDICKKLGINVDTFAEYKNKYPELPVAIKKGKQNLQIDLEKTVFQRAKGFYVTETKLEIKKGENPYKKVIRNKRYICSDTLLIFALANLGPDKWKRQDTDQMTNKDLNIKIKIEDEEEK
jgi:hypothetical protein